MRFPTATYRVQFNKDFRFSDALKLLPYLDRIGISDLYASPIFQARAGSMHGYDVTDPTRINPEVGSLEEFDQLVEQLHRRGMSLLLDIVPNHMAASLENPWWMDVLENGSASEHAAYFDVEWGHRTPSVRDKIVLPILGEPYVKAIEGKKLQLSLCENGIRVSYGFSAFPVDPGTYHAVLSDQLDEFLRDSQADSPSVAEFGLLLEMTERLPARISAEWEEVELRRRNIPVIKHRLWELYTSSPEVKTHLERNLTRFNGIEGDPSSFDKLDDLLDNQPYQFMFWRVARERINYRRFFDVTDLVGLRAQDPQVFESTHALILQWVEQKKVTGLRIDHVDGLYDPLAYLARLQARAAYAAGGPVYVSVEKIVSGDEALPNEWPVAGTTGYDFLGIVNNLFVDPEGLKVLTATYGEFIANDTSFYEIAYTKKKQALHDLFTGEIRTLGLQVNRIAERYRHARDLSPETLSRALLEVTASMPVYRTYTRDFQIGSRDSLCIEDATASARRRNPELDSACFDFVRQVLLVELSADEDVLRLVMRWQQLTGPVMAKGIEDTTLYVYNRLTSMNDVGGSPEAVTHAHFHEFNAMRSRQWPGAMNATSTHDTKRSEDVRARINLLSEMPAEWTRNVKRWHNWNRQMTGSIFPIQDPNQEYLLYQSLLGVWPLEGAITPDLIERIKAYMIKAAREAKTHTSWLHQDDSYERNMLEFVDGILQESSHNRFLPHFRHFQKRLAFYGALNSLSQTLLKCVCPGVPDFYQGTTIWDFSLVDPDNRRRPQIAPRLDLLEQFAEWESPLPQEALGELLASWVDGRVKAFVICKALQLRKQQSELFDHGEYFGLNGTGLALDHTVALARKRGDRWMLAIAPRFLTSLTALEKMPLDRRFWKDSGIVLPEGAPGAWHNVFTGEQVKANASLLVADALKSFPVALLVSD